MSQAPGEFVSYTTEQLIQWVERDLHLPPSVSQVLSLLFWLFLRALHDEQSAINISFATIRFQAFRAWKVSGADLLGTTDAELIELGIDGAFSRKVL
jgi:hypothetical protein